MIRNGKRVIQKANPRGAAVAPKHHSKPKANKPKKQQPPKPIKKPVVPPSLLKAGELSDQLAQQFTVWAEFKPLAVGVEREVFQVFGAANTKGASKKTMQKTLAMHTRHPKYLHALQSGGSRYHLDGRVADDITPYQAGLAGEWLAKKSIE